MPESAQATPLESVGVVVLAANEDAAKLKQSLQQLDLVSFSGSITVLCSSEHILKQSQVDSCNAVALSLGRDIDCRPLMSSTIVPQRYWLDILKALDYRGEPLVFIHAAAVPVSQWQQRMATQLLEASPEGFPPAMAVSALSAKHPLHRITNSVLNSSLSAEQLDQWLSEYAQGDNFDLPAVLPGLAALGGKAWPEIIAASNADAELFIRAKAAGPLLGSDQVYVDDSGLGDELFSVEELNPIRLDAVTSQHPFGATQFALSDLASRAEAPPTVQENLPCQLHIAHSWGGGLGRWVEDAIESDRHHRNLVLRPLGTWDAFGQSLALYHNAQMGVPLKQWLLAEFIPATEVHHHQYQTILADIIKEFNVERLVVSSLIGQSLDALRTGLPTTVVAHDFYPYCPALVASFSKPCLSCDSKMQAKCKGENSHHQHFNNVENLHWDCLRPEYGKLLQQNSVSMVAPCNSVVARMKSLQPELEHKAIHVIEHGLNETFIESFNALREQAPHTGKKLRIVVLGSLATIKGSDILTAALPELLKFADLHLLGSGESGEKYKGRDGINVVSHYHRDELPGLLAEVNPDLGVLLSIVPETFSYTLSELWAACIPVVATKLGAFEDRVQPGKTGWLVEPNKLDLLEQLNELNKDRDSLAAARRFLQAAEPKTSSSMADDYYQLHPLTPAPMKRFHLGRRSFDNPYRQGAAEKTGEVLYIDPQNPYRKVLAEFLKYSHAKLVKSPRLPAVFRRPLSWVLRKTIAYLG